LHCNKLLNQSLQLQHSYTHYIRYIIYVLLDLFSFINGTALYHSSFRKKMIKLVWNCSGFLVETEGDSAPMHFHLHVIIQENEHWPWWRVVIFMWYIKLMIKLMLLSRLFKAVDEIPLLHNWNELYKSKCGCKRSLYLSLIIKYRDDYCNGAVHPYIYICVSEALTPTNPSFSFYLSSTTPYSSVFPSSAQPCNIIK
jgi:hypothetical protein